MRRSILFGLLFLMSMPVFAQYWQHCTLPAPYSAGYYLDVFFLPSNAQYGWACGFNGYTLRTTDGGTTWQGSFVPPPYKDSSGHLESIHFTTQQVGYCSGPAGVFKTTNGGASWINVTPTIPNGQRAWGLYFLNADYGIVLSGGCVTDQYFIRTTNGGTSWSIFTASLANNGMTDLILYPSGLGIAVGSGNLWKSLDSGATWAPWKTPFPAIWNEELAVNGASILVPWSGSTCAGAGANDGGGRFSADSGASWLSYNTGQHMFGSFLLSSTKGWMCGNARAMWYTSDAGVNWELKNCGIDGDLDDCWFINDSTGFIAGNGIYRYSNPERTVSKTLSDFGSFCFPGIRYDTLFIRNKSWNGVNATWSLAGIDVQHFDVLQPVSANFGIPACDSAMIIVRFQPRSSGTKSAVLNVTLSTGTGTTFTVNLNGASRTATTVPVDTLVQVASVPCGVVVRLVTGWNNTSTFTDQIIQIQKVSGATFNPDPGLPYIIPPGGSSVGMSITVPDTGWQTGRYMFRVGPCLHDTILTLRAYGVSPIITTSSLKTFTSKCLSSVLDSVAVTNTGNADLIINNNYISSGSTEFTVVGWNTGESLPVTIKRNATKFIYIRFSPQSGGTKLAQLRISDNDQTTARGVKTLVDILLQGTSVGLADSVSVRDIDFGDLCIGKSAVRDVIVYNTNADSSFDILLPPQLRPEFTFDAGGATFPLKVPAKGSVKFTVSFKPTSTGNFDDSLLIQLRLPPCNLDEIIRLHGRGVSTEVTVNPTRIDTIMKAGTTATFDVELTSTGTSDAIIGNIVLSPVRTDWKIISQPLLPYTLSPGRKVRVTVELSPTTSTVFSGQLTFNITGVCSTTVKVDFNVGVSNTAVVIPKTPIDFGLVKCLPAILLDSVVVRNNGTTPDTIVSAVIQSSTAHYFDLISPTTFPVEIAQGKPVSLVVRSRLVTEGIDTARLIVQFANSFGGVPVTILLRAEYRKSITNTIDTLVDFGTSELCDAVKTATIHLNNAGTLDDNLQFSQQGSDPAISVSRTNLTVKAHGSESVIVTFDPRGSSAHAINQLLQWTSTVCGDIIKTHIVATIIDPHLTITPTDLQFGKMWKGSTQTLYIGVKNNSAAPRTITNVVFNPGSSPDFTVNYAANTMLLVGDSTTITVTFTAASDGNFSAQLNVHEESSCRDSTLVTMSAFVPKELYVATLSAEKYVTTVVGDTTDVHVVLKTDDSSDQAMWKAHPVSLSTTLEYNDRVMNVLRVFSTLGGAEHELPFQKTSGKLIVFVPDSAVRFLGASDTLFTLRAQGMQSIPNFTIVDITGATADIPGNKDYRIDVEDGDFTVVACVKWARIDQINKVSASIVSQPVFDDIEIEINTTTASEVFMELSNLYGQQVLRKVMPVHTGSSRISVSTQSLASGTYFLVLRDSNGQSRLFPLTLVR